MSIEFNGRVYQTGYLPQRNSKELRYAFRSTPPRAIDWNVPAVVQNTPSYRFQNGEPSCVGHSLSAAFQVLHPDMPIVSAPFIWQSAKNLRGWKGYTGVYINDGCDVSLPGVPAETDLPSNFSTQDYSIPSNLTLYDAFQSHQVTTANHADQIYDAISSGLAVVTGIGMDSLSFNNMQFNGGLVSTFNQDRSKWDFWHAMLATAAVMLPNGRKVIIYQNSWLQFWDGNRSIHPLVTGYHVAIDVDVLNVVAFEHRVISPEPRQADPIPEPQPQPEPEPEPQPQSQIDFKQYYYGFANSEIEYLAQQQANEFSDQTRIQHYIEGINRLTNRINSA